MTRDKQGKKPLELYIHIPFCEKKCNYCDFLSFRALPQVHREYTDQLCREIRAAGNGLREFQAVTIFIGGGTPSVFDPLLIRKIMETVGESFSLDPEAEATIEVNPGTLLRNKLPVYRSCGINRLSIGLQSADNGDLAWLGRIHSFEDFLKTFQYARMEGFSNISVDLMSGIPGQTLPGWEETLRKTAELGPEHISAYGLIIEEGTPFYEMYGEDGKDRAQHEGELPDEETERLMYHWTREILEEYGFTRYEISNYAKPGFACRHNLGYWERTEYLGIGTGAASLIGNQRWNEGGEKITLSGKDQMEEYMFLGLRKMEGVSKAEFSGIFGCEIEAVYGDVIQKMCEKNLLEISGDFIRLTDFGIDVSNYVMSEFLL